MNSLSKFQLLLLRNMVVFESSLRNGGAPAVQELIEKGFIEHKGGLFVATEKAGKEELLTALKKADEQTSASKDKVVLDPEQVVTPEE